MSLTLKNTQAFELLATKLVELHDEHGDLTTLTTTAKGDFVAAINEVKAVADAAASGNVSINDAAASTTEVYSSQKTEDRLAEILTAADAAAVAAITAALEGEDLSDLAGDIAALDTRVTALETAVGDEAAYDPVAAINAILNF